jgi:transposase
MELALRRHRADHRGVLLPVFATRGRHICFEEFLKELSESYADERIALVLDNGPSHLAADVEVPQNVTLLPLPSYSPELNPVERWFLEFRRALANRSFETIDALHQAITRAIEPYWHAPEKLRRLTGFPWWREAVDQICTQ